MCVAATPAFDKGLYYEILHPLSAFSVGDVREHPVEVLQFLHGRKRREHHTMNSRKCRLIYFGFLAETRYSFHRQSSRRSSVLAMIRRFCRNTRNSKRCTTQGTTIKGALLVAGGSQQTDKNLMKSKRTQHAMERRERRSYFGRSADCFMSPNKMTLRAPKGSSSTLPACGLRVWSTQLKIPAMAFQASVSIIPVSWKITLELNIEWGWC
jgi:hypothetical protein